MKTVLGFLLIVAGCCSSSNNERIVMESDPPPPVVQDKETWVDDTFYSADMPDETPVDAEMWGQ